MVKPLYKGFFNVIVLDLNTFLCSCLKIVSCASFQEIKSNTQTFLL